MIIGFQFSDALNTEFVLCLFIQVMYCFMVQNEITDWYQSWHQIITYVVLFLCGPGKERIDVRP